MLQSVFDQTEKCCDNEEFDSQIESQLRAEYAQECILEPYVPEAFEPQEEYKRKQLVREVKAAALHRQEEAARTEEDFLAVIKEWDKNDDNRERRERYNEVLRGDVPIDYGCSYAPDLNVFPKYLNTTAERQLAEGNCLDFIFDCPFEMHDLTSIKYVTDIVYSLKDEYKEILYWFGVKNFKVKHVAEMRGQTDRNIRRQRSVVFHRLWKMVYEELALRQQKGLELSAREIEFMHGYEKGTLVMCNDEKTI